MGGGNQGVCGGTVQIRRGGRNARRGGRNAQSDGAPVLLVQFVVDRHRLFFNAGYEDAEFKTERVSALQGGLSMRRQNASVNEGALPDVGQIVHQPTHKGTAAERL